MRRHVSGDSFDAGATKAADPLPGRDVIAVAAQSATHKDFAVAVAADDEPVRSVLRPGARPKRFQQPPLDDSEDLVAARSAGLVALADAHSARRAQAVAEARSLASASRLLEVEGDLARTQAHAGRLAEEYERSASVISELTQRLERADRVLLDMTSCVSWRLTSPLRAAKRLIRLGSTR
jgi:hypothetical protein